MYTQLQHMSQCISEARLCEVYDISIHMIVQSEESGTRELSCKSFRLSVLIRDDTMFCDR